MMRAKFWKLLLAACILTLVMVTESRALSVIQTTDTTDLKAALGAAGLTINSVSITNGAASQFGTYTGFTSPPVTIGDGVVMSTGEVGQTTAAFHNSGNLPSSDMGVSGTAEFNNYGPGHIANFGSTGTSPGSNDVAALKVNFTLSVPGQVGFNFVFGSVEYPDWTSIYTDAFIAFLDGTTDQIVFDASNKAVQVGTSFASALTTADTNTAFSSPHGLMKLQTFTDVLGAGDHSILFEIGDVNDHILDSAVFIYGFYAGAGTPGTQPVDAVPEPATMLLLGSGLIGLAGYARKSFKNR